MSRAKWIVLTLFAATAFGAPAQVTNPIPPQFIIVPGGGSVQLRGPVPTQPITPGISVMHAPLDTNAPIAAFAEFDPAMVGGDGKSTFRIVVSCPIGDVRPPERIPAPEGLALAPGASGQQLVQTGNRARRLWTFNFHAYAEQEGSFTVPAFTLFADGKPVEVPAATLQRTSGDVSAQRPVELALKAPNRTIYAGETIPINVRVSGGIDGRLQNVTQLDLRGESFLVDQNSIIARQRKSISLQGGRPVVAIETDALVTPLRAGALRLHASTEVTLESPTSGLAALVPGYRPLVEAMPLSLKVTGLPTNGVLPGFNGAIGEFHLQPPKLSSTQVRVGDPLTLSVTLVGEGNLATIPAPALPKSAGWQTMPPRLDPPQGISGGMNAMRTFHYTLIPLDPGLSATPAIPFSYFHPRMERFVNLTIPAHPVTVTPAPDEEIAAASTGVPPPAPPQPAPPAAPEERIRPIADSMGRTAGTLVPLQTRGWFLLAQLIPAAFLGGIWLWDRRRRYLAANPEILIFRRASRSGRRHLAEARAAAASKNAPRFANSIVHAMRSLCAPRVNANPDSLVCADILGLLPDPARAGRDAELVRAFFSVMDGQRFGSAAANGDSMLLRQAAEAEMLLQLMHDRLRGYVSLCVRQRRARRARSAILSFSTPLRRSGDTGRLSAKTAVLLTLIFAAVPARGSTASEWFEQGVAAYVAGDYDRAVTAFEECVALGPSAGALHNLGNAQWARENRGQAILAWERAAWLDAYERNSRSNLRVARRLAQLDAPQLTWFEMCSAWLPANAWAWVATGSFWFGAAVLILPPVSGWRRAYWHQIAGALGLTVFLLTLPALAGVYSRAQRGVIVTEETPVRLTPTSDGEVLMRLPAGETASLARRKGGYLHIRTAGGGSGWVTAENFRLVAE